MDHGFWAFPNPSFSGEIVLCNDGYLRGYCEEFYESVFVDKQSDENKFRFIFGRLGISRLNNSDGLVFYKLSNNEQQGPLLYAIHDFDNQSKNIWLALGDNTGKIGFACQGSAKVKLEEIEYDQEKFDSISAKFDEIEKEGNLNDLLFLMFDKFASQILK